ncbi:MAG: tRNA preQ1(34) S-adenosylmethionine ribosyltransferase-isomerase QueA [Myxococcales bacterium]|nr:tRNA preQ1(34) S-adenosylmethionine ribosyltransferase-isomerase QueA [Myxococcales bacterium]
MTDLRASDFDFELPDQLIAQRPRSRRDGARLLVLERATGRVTHSDVLALPEVLGDRETTMVVNDTRVIPARLAAQRESGGRVELLLVEPADGADDARLEAGERVSTWRAMSRASKKLRAGERLALLDAQGAPVAGASAELLDAPDGGRVTVRLEGVADLARLGAVPLPPYIRRDADDADRTRYQTVYARARGSVAAPTAGLHLSEPLLESLVGAGVELCSVTLHVGPGTFVPVRAERIVEHQMESERYLVPEQTASAIAAARARGGRVLAVGTTSVRTLEASGGAAGSGRTSLYIYPGYTFGVVDALLTNFHLPRSTLLMLVCAFGGREAVLAAYREAVAEGYRFYSYGDAMLLI